MRVVLKNFRIVDEEIDVHGTVIIQDGIIVELISEEPAGVTNHKVPPFLVLYSVRTAILLPSTLA